MLDQTIFFNVKTNPATGGEWINEIIIDFNSSLNIAFHSIDFFYYANKIELAFDICSMHLIENGKFYFN